METNFPTLNTDRLLLREIIDSDLENIFNGLSHPDVIRHYGISFQLLLLSIVLFVSLVSTTVHF